MFCLLFYLIYGEKNVRGLLQSPSLLHVYQQLHVCGSSCGYELKFILEVRVCARPLRLLLDTACWVVVMLKRPPPRPRSHPLAGGWPWQGLTESWPGGGSTELHASPLSQPTQSVQVYRRLDKHTRTHTRDYRHYTRGGPRSQQMY